MCPFIGLSSLKLSSILLSISHTLSFCVFFHFGVVQGGNQEGMLWNKVSCWFENLSYNIFESVACSFFISHFCCLSIHVIRLLSRCSSEAPMMLNDTFSVRLSLFTMLDLANVFYTVDFLSSVKCQDSWLLWHLVFRSLHVSRSFLFCFLGYYFFSASTCLISVSQSCILFMWPFLLLILSFFWFQLFLTLRSYLQSMYLPHSMKTSTQHSNSLLVISSLSLSTSASPKQQSSSSPKTWFFFFFFP